MSLQHLELLWALTWEFKRKILYKAKIKISSSLAVTGLSVILNMIYFL